MFKTNPTSKKKKAPRVCLELEGLEERRVMSVTNHGGAVLPNVEVQALYYGSDWLTSAAYRTQTTAIDGFLNDVVHSPYMDLLTNAGYGVGRGSSDAGKL